MMETIQPSSDIRATTIAIAWQIAQNIQWNDGSIEGAKKAAQLVGELAHAIYSAAHKTGSGK